MIEPQVRPLESDGTVCFYQGEEKEMYMNQSNNGNHYGWNNPKNPHYQDRNLPIGDGTGVFLVLIVMYIGFISIRNFMKK